MNHLSNYASPYAVANQPTDVRTAFIRKTYAHLGGSILAFILVECLFMQLQPMRQLAMTMLQSWLIVIAAFVGVSYLAERWARSATSKPTQYLGLGLFIVAEAIVFLPLILIAHNFYPGIITQAGIITAGLFAGITFIAFTTKKDFSFLSGFLKIAFFVALGLIIAAQFTQAITLGLWFSAAMALVAAIAILRDTSNIIHHYQTNQYVAAALGLFASVALLFYYVLTTLMSLARSSE